MLLLLQLLDLLQGEEGFAPPLHSLLGVCHRPLLEVLGVATLHVQAQVLSVLGHEVTHAAGEGLLSCRGAGHGQETVIDSSQEINMETLSLADLCA